MRAEGWKLPLSANAAAFGGIVAAALLVQFSLGLNAVILPLKMNSLGFSNGTIGLCFSFEILGVVLFCKQIARLIAGSGILNVLLAAACCRAIMLWFLKDQVYWQVWAVMMFLYGIATNISIVSLQTWLNLLKFQRHKNLCIGIFSSSLSAGVALGPVILPWITAEQGSNPFQTNAMICLLSSGILLPLWKSRPAESRALNPRIWYVLNRARAAMYSAFVGGITFFGLPAFLTLYGIRSGLSITDSSFLISAFMIGSIFLGMVVSTCSLWIHRQLLMVWSILVGMLCAVYLPIAIYHYHWSLVLLFVWGGVAGGIYSLSLASVGSLFRREDQLSANVTYTLLDCSGGITGVFLIGLSLDHFGPDGLTRVIKFAGILYFIFLLSTIKVDKAKL